MPTVVQGETYGKSLALTGPEQLPGEDRKNFLAKCLLCGNSRRIAVCGRFHGCSCNKGHIKHGAHGTRLYRVWCSMKARCNSERQQDYGGRGIGYCEEWEDFAPFSRWATETGGVPGLELDRVDVNGRYCPENCRWVTKSQNLNNRRNSRFLTAFGDTKTIAEWTRDARCGLSFGTISSRLKNSWSDQDAIEKPKGYRHDWS